MASESFWLHQQKEVERNATAANSGARANNGASWNNKKGIFCYFDRAYNEGETHEAVNHE